MLNEYLDLQIDVKGKTLNGFCMRIQDNFHLTYAVVIDGYHSFAIWLDDKKSEWCASKFTNLDQNVVDRIIDKLKFSDQEKPFAVG